MRRIPGCGVGFERGDGCIRWPGPLRIVEMGKCMRRNVHVMIMRARGSGLYHGDTELGVIIRGGRWGWRLMISKFRFP